MTSRVINAAAVVGRPVQRLTLLYATAYQGTSALGAGAYTATWDYGQNKWISDMGGAELTIPLLAYGTSGTAGQLTGYLSVFDGPGGTARMVSLPLTGQETAPGVLDLQVPAAPTKWIVDTALNAHLENLRTLTAQGNSALALARAGIGVANTANTSANSAISTLTGRIQAAAEGAAATATAAVQQLVRNAVAAATSATAAAVASGRYIAASSVAAIALTAGLYLITGNNVNAGQVWERPADTTQAPVRRPELEAASQMAVQLAQSITQYPTPASLSLVAPVIGELYRFADGSRWEWVSAATATRLGAMSNGGTVVEALGGGFWMREYAGDLVAAWFGVTPDTGTDQGPQIQAWLDAARVGDTLRQPRGAYLTGQMNVCRMDGVQLIWDGTLSPAPGYTGYVLKLEGGNGTATARQFGTYAQGYVWQRRMHIHRLSIDGLDQSQGLWAAGLDHSWLANIAVRYCKGRSVLWDGCRESTIVEINVAAFDTGDNLPAMYFYDTAATTDPNNTLTFISPRMEYGRGVYLGIDTASQNGNIPRLITFVNPQIEALGDATDAAVKHKDGTVIVRDVTQDIVQFVICREIKFLAGHISCAKLVPPTTGGLGAGGALLRYGTDPSGSKSNKVTKISFVNTSVWVDNAEGYVHAVHNGYDLDLGTDYTEANKATKIWVNPAYTSNDPVAISYKPLHIIPPTGAPALLAEGLPGQQSSSRVYFRQGDGQGDACVYLESNVLWLQPQVGIEVYIGMAPSGEIFARGAELRVGRQGSGVGSLNPDTLHAAPAGAYAGMVVMADGHDWAPNGITQASWVRLDVDGAWKKV